MREAAIICPRPCDLGLWPFDLESGVRGTCEVGYLCVNFLCSRLRPDVRDRQADVRQHHRLMPPPRGRGIITGSIRWAAFLDAKTAVMATTTCTLTAAVLRSPTVGSSMNVDDGCWVCLVASVRPFPFLPVTAVGKGFPIRHTTIEHMCALSTDGHPSEIHHLLPHRSIRPNSDIYHS